MNKYTSPCVRNCCLSEANICLGCFRSLDEICQWGGASEEQKNDILLLAQNRKAAYKLKFGLNDSWLK